MARRVSARLAGHLRGTASSAPRLWSRGEIAERTAWSATRRARARRFLPTVPD